MKELSFNNDVLPLKNQLYRLALRLTLSHQEAEDIVQDTLIKVWNRREHWDEIESMEAFAMRICRNISLDHLKLHENRNVSLDDVSVERPDTLVSPLEQLQQQDHMQHLKNIVDALPEKQKVCMQLRDFEGKSYKEIASVLMVTEDQVKVNIFRARKTVKERFLMLTGDQSG